MSRTAIPQAAVISIALTMLWLNWAQAIQAILLLFAFGSVAFHLWLNARSVLRRLKELPPASEQSRAKPNALADAH